LFLLLSSVAKIQNYTLPAVRLRVNELRGKDFPNPDFKH
jgi:hypothetical protein